METWNMTNVAGWLDRTKLLSLTISRYSMANVTQRLT